MKYYIGDINVQNGEYSHTSTIKFRTSGNPEKALGRIARHWYDGAEEQDGKGSGAWYANCGEVATSAGLFQEIDKGTFEKLHLISEL